MNNAETRFAMNPTGLDIQRSRFQRDHQHKTTFNAGDLIPIFVDEYLPGDTFSIDTSFVCRMSTLLHPVMDNAYLDFFFFSVPYRLLWEHWEEFNGANKTSAWEQTIEYEIPQLLAPSGGWSSGTVADYMGLPINVANTPSVNALPFRAYAMIWNEWFRDENLQDPVLISNGDAASQGVNSGAYVSAGSLGGPPLKVQKFHDYFTSALPEPQKGPDVLLPLGINAPVYPTETAIPENLGASWVRYNFTGSGNTPLQPGQHANLALDYTSNENFDSVLAAELAESSTSLLGNPYPANLWADLSNATAATINQLRQAFQIQRLYEKDARGGTRYTEVIRSHFGVISPDARLQRPEYLGGKRIPINVDQVLQTSATVSSGDDASPQGNAAAYSLTGGTDSSFTKSFTEHGIVIGLACVRTEHTYQQGIERFWSRKSRFDFYWPVLANLGEQPIYNKEIFTQGSAADDEVFGYQEAWAEYRYKPSRVSGELRSTYAQSLDTWHYGDDYASLPVLGPDWIQETPVNIDRTLAVQSSTSHQFIADFFFKCSCVRPMPMYSIPGLIDHH